MKAGKKMSKIVSIRKIKGGCMFRKFILVIFTVCLLVSCPDTGGGNGKEKTEEPSGPFTPGYLQNTAWENNDLFGIQFEKDDGITLIVRDRHSDNYFLKYQGMKVSGRITKKTVIAGVTTLYYIFDDYPKYKEEGNFITVENNAVQLVNIDTVHLYGNFQKKAYNYY
jgi:hypothetical protein